MTPPEYDVHVCWRAPSGAGLAGVVSEGLRGRGFRLSPAGRDTAPASPGPHEAPDFVLVLAPGTLEPCSDPADPVRLEIARAIATRRNIVPVAVPGWTMPPAEALPVELRALSTCLVTRYDADRRAESIALVAHRLSSDTTVGDRAIARRSRRVLAAGALVVVAAIALDAVPALLKVWKRAHALPPLPPLVLYWAAFGQRIDHDSPVEFPVAETSTVQAGDRVRVVFSPSADGYAYVVSRSVRGEVSVLFPADTLAGASRVRAAERYGAPVATEWLTMDDVDGPEVLYVIASYDPLQNLEELLEQPSADAGTRRDLLESTVSGLLDTRHYVLAQRVRTRTGQEIDQGLHARPGPGMASVTLADGAVVRHAMSAQPGLVSAAVEIRLRRAPAR